MEKSIGIFLPQVASNDTDVLFMLYCRVAFCCTVLIVIIIIMLLLYIFVYPLV